jgi:hypothetical protein
MRKLLQIAFGVLKSGIPFDAAICMAAAPAVNAPSAKVQTRKEQQLALAA